MRELVKALTVLAVVALLAPARSQTPYVITGLPIAAVSADSLIEIRWSGGARPGRPAPDSGWIYYGRMPGGSRIANYPNRVTVTVVNNMLIPGTPPQRQIYFRPSAQNDMSAGLFYFMVAFNDSLYSNEGQLIVESNRATVLKGPSGIISDLTPAISWENNPGVPYYHVLLSDEAIKIDGSGGSGRIDVTGISIVWQAITAATQIVYGAPDPSGTITASPPPLSPGRTYSVVVLNNYGNDPAYTSTRVGLPGSFTLRGDTLRAPVNVSPAPRDTISSDSLTFRWTGLDPRANTYQVYVYMASSLTNAQNSIAAQMVVWDGEVTAKTFTGDTARLRINARNVLTRNNYTWKVIAVDNRGAGRAGDTTGFYYQSSTGTIRIQTREKIAVGNDTITSAVANAELRVEVLEGSLEKPIHLYTDNNGLLVRDRPVGMYRITAIKRGFDPVSRIITVSADSTSESVFYLRRPDATIFGRAVDEADQGVGLVQVTAVSATGDTVRAQSDQTGSFVLNCTQGDWIVWAAKSGYRPSLPREVDVVYGQSFSLGTIALRSNPLTISGHVVNESGSRLIGVRVLIAKEGVVIGEMPSTAQNGEFAFSVEPGTYTLSASKTGFTTVSRVLQVATSQQTVLTMSSGAALVTGSVISKSVIGDRIVFAPIPGAVVTFVGLDGASDTVMAASDATYGIFRANLAGGRRYSVFSRASGHAIKARRDTIQTLPGVTQEYRDTLQALARIRGTVVLVDPETGTSRGALGGVTVSLIDGAGATIASTRSQSDGHFELSGLHDGTFFVRAGKDGLFASGFEPTGTVEVIDGGILLAGVPGVDFVTVRMAPGTKTIKWVADGGQQTQAVVRIRSPLQKVIDIGDSLVNAGPGEYVVVVDATADSIVDLSYHAFSVGDTVSRYIDSVVLPVIHKQRDTLAVSNDSVTLFLNSRLMLDSATVYFRDMARTLFDSLRVSSASDQYAFRFRPQRDGSTMLYYFRAHRGRDVYGYQQRLFQTYVRPERKLSKLEITPWADTLTLASRSDITFRFRGYYGTGFLLDTTVYAGQVRWTLSNAQESRISSHGEFATVTTGIQPTQQGLVRLTASVPSSIVREGIDTTVTVVFSVTGQRLERIEIRRIDPAAPKPITTSLSARAEFVLEAFDGANTPVTVSPQWGVVPAEAGTISPFGVFRPSSRFIGTARITANAGGLTAEFTPATGPGTLPGLEIHHVVAQQQDPDTAKNFDGVTIVLPGNVVTAGKTALFQLRTAETGNIVQKGLRTWKLVGSAHDIIERNNVDLRLMPSSPATLIIDLPSSESRSGSTGGLYCIARWNPDSLSWDTLGHSRLTPDGKAVMVTLTRFSRYAVLKAQSGFSAELSVSPNPFSPFVQPAVVTGEESRYGSVVHRGTCISFTVGSEYQYNEAQLRIYSVVGDLVWSVSTKDLTAGRHHVWWNGMSTDRDIPLDKWNERMNAGHTAGSRMCRNGRYYVVLTLKDIQGREKRLMKPVILIK